MVYQGAGVLQQKHWTPLWQPRQSEQTAPRQHSHEQHIEELRAALARMLHMHHMMLETTHYRENITDARCIREMHEAPLQALNILSRYPHKKDEV